MCAVRGSDSPLTQSRICVVDDNESVRNALSNLLRSAGYAAVCFAGGKACLAYDSLAEFDFAVFDIKLNDMSGFVLHEQLAAIGITMPVIFVSGNGDSAVELRAMRAGAIAFLRKPIDVDMLLDRIDQALDSRRPHR